MAPLMSAVIRRARRTPTVCQFPSEMETERWKVRGLKYHNTKAWPGNKPQCFPQTRVIIWSILSGNNDDDRPGAGGAIITSPLPLCALIPDTAADPFNNDNDNCRGGIVAPRLVVLTGDKFLIRRINWLDCNCRCACYQDEQSICMYLTSHVGSRTEKGVRG